MALFQGTGAETSSEAITLKKKAPKQKLAPGFRIELLLEVLS